MNHVYNNYWDNAGELRFITNRPDWLRWILLIPVTIVVTFIFGAVFSYKWGFYNPFSVGFMTAAIVIVPPVIAPKGKLTTLIVSGSLWASIHVIDIIYPIIGIVSFIDVSSAGVKLMAIITDIIAIASVVFVQMVMIKRHTSERSGKNETAYQNPDHGGAQSQDFEPSSEPEVEEPFLIKTDQGLQHSGRENEWMREAIEEMGADSTENAICNDTLTRRAPLTDEELREKFIQELTNKGMHREKAEELVDSFY